VNIIYLIVQQQDKEKLVDFLYIPLRKLIGKSKELKRSNKEILKFELGFVFVGLEQNNLD
jgi:hypothetical protein